jgi:hypothetical protein
MPQDNILDYFYSHLPKDYDRWLKMKDFIALLGIYQARPGHPRSQCHGTSRSGEVGEGGGFGFEGGDGFDEAGDGEGVADAAGAAYEAKDAAFAR